MKVCRICKIEKDESEFMFRKDTQKLRSECRTCHYKRKAEYATKNIEKTMAFQKEYREANKDKLIAWAKDYYEKNREERLEANKRYYEKNKKKIFARSNEVQRHRVMSDPEFRLKRNISTLFRNALKRADLIKKSETFAYTGITMQEYARHFENDPLWNIYKDKSEVLHIDHIIPQSLYSSDPDEIKKCWNPRNLRLLPARENVSKFNKLLPELVKQYQIEDLLPKGIII